MPIKYGDVGRIGRFLNECGFVDNYGCWERIKTALAEAHPQADNNTQPAILLEDLENILFVEWCAWERIGEKNWVKHIMKKIRLYAKQQAGARCCSQ